IKPEIRFTPPRRARRRMAGFVIPWMLSLSSNFQYWQCYRVFVVGLCDFDLGYLKLDKRLSRRVNDQQGRQFLLIYERFALLTLKHSLLTSLYSKMSKPASASKPAHPPYSVMVVAAVAGLKERNGSSRQAIVKYVQSNYVGIGGNCSKMVNKSIKNLKEAGKVRDGKGGPFKFALTEAAKAKPATKKPVAKKTTKPKKPAAAKKPATKKPAGKKPAGKKASDKKKAAKKTGTPKKGAKTTTKKSKAKSPAKRAGKKPTPKKAGKKPAAKKAQKK
ncbi:histone H1-like, partial [Paramuricea clavata]